MRSDSTLSSWLPLFAAVLVVVVGLAAGDARGQVRHREPSELALRAGRDLERETTLEAALERAAREARPVLWYVPTVPRSPMDRQQVVDLYIQAGFFADPDLRPELARFVLLEKVPSRDEAKRFDLAPFRFIEPGFVVLDKSGAERGRVHALTTFSPTWFTLWLDEFVGEVVGGTRTKPGSVDANLPPSAAALREARLRGRSSEVASMVRRLRSMSRTLEPELATQLALAELSGIEAMKREPGKDSVTTPSVPAAIVPSMSVYAEAALLRATEATAMTRFLKACIAARSGRQLKARELWLELARDGDAGPVAARAAAEAEGFGPIARGFWSFRALPFAWTATGPVASSTRPCIAADLATLRERGLDFLLAMQNEAGGFEDSNYDFGGLDSLPNVYVAVTALCTEALLGELVVGDFGSSAEGAARAGRLEAAIAKGIGYVFDDSKINPDDEDEWIWARAYPIELAVRLLEVLSRDAEALRFIGRDKEALVAKLRQWTQEVYTRQGQDGSFRHEYANPFVTATVLHALDAARVHGVTIPEPERERALASLEACRTKLGAYSYGQARAGRTARAGVDEAAGRMPLCESALLLFERSDAATLGLALAAAFEHHGQLESTRKYDDHANRLRYGGFFFWFDLRARGRALALLEKSGSDERVATWKRELEGLVLGIPEFDGVFVDSHELGRCYGTAMALLTLRMR